MTSATDITRTHSDAELVERLGALAAAAGASKLAARRLAARGITATAGELEVLRDQHTAFYMAIAEDHARAVEEGIAQSYREIVVAGQRLTKGYLDKLNDDLDAGIMPRDIERTVQATAKVLQTSTDKLLSITGRPVSGAAGSDPLESLKELEKLGIATRVERPTADADATAEEVPED